MCNNRSLKVSTVLRSRERDDKDTPSQMSVSLASEHCCFNVIRKNNVQCRSGGSCEIHIRDEDPRFALLTGSGSLRALLIFNNKRKYKHIRKDQNDRKTPSQVPMLLTSGHYYLNPIERNN